MPSGECSIEPWVFMNWRRAAYYLYLAEVIDAKKALEVGLVNEVFRASDWTPAWTPSPATSPRRR